MSSMSAKALACLAAILLLAAPAAAADREGAPVSNWCGENGLIRFSFAEGDSLVPVLRTEEPLGGVTRTDLYCWLTDVERVVRDGEHFLALGGFELKLDITGAEAFILKQEFQADGLNVGMAPGMVAFGHEDGQSIRGGRTLLVHWELMFQGRPRNVRIGLDPAGVRSCKGDAGCEGTGTPAVYIGTAASKLLTSMFGAGYEPAWINPDGEPDLTPVRGASTWRDVGIFSEP